VYTDRVGVFSEVLAVYARLLGLRPEIEEEFGGTAPEQLAARRIQLRRRIFTRRQQRTLTLTVGVLLSLAAIAAYLYWHVDPFILAAGVGYGVLFVLVGLFQPGPAILELDLLDVEAELDLLTYDPTQQEQRAERLFKLHQRELNKYYEITLRQSRLIFYVGVGSIVAGLLIIGLALYFISIEAKAAALSDKVVIAALASVGSLLSNFVAAIYLRMFSETIQSMTEFHSRLVVTHHLHYGSFLAAKITSETLRNRTIAEMAVISARGAGPLTRNSPSTAKRPTSRGSAAVPT